MGGGLLWEVVSYGRWSPMGGGLLWEVVSYGRWSPMGGGVSWRLHCMMTYIKSLSYLNKSAS